jgi:hypothetical protein
VSLRTRRRRAADSEPQLDASIVKILLGGWLAPGPADPRTPAEFELWMARGPGVARLWRRHEPFLRREAARLGIAPAWDDGRLFFGEYLARRVARPAGSADDADADDDAVDW